MKKSILIACETLKEEVEKLMESIDKKPDVVWMEGGLHISPENLRDHIQMEIEKHDGNYEEIILVYGFCGGGVEALETKTSTLIIPRVEDCISILLGGDSERSKVNEIDKPFFLTKGWVRTINEMEGLNFKSIKKKYGDELAKKLYKEICGSYCNIDIIDTGAYKIEEIDDELVEILDALQLPSKTIGCNLIMMEQLLNRKWNENFVIKRPGQKVERSDYYQ